MKIPNRFVKDCPVAGHSCRGQLNGYAFIEALLVQYGFQIGDEVMKEYCLGFRVRTLIHSVGKGCYDRR